MALPLQQSDEEEPENLRSEYQINPPSIEARQGDILKLRFCGVYDSLVGFTICI